MVDGDGPAPQTPVDPRVAPTLERMRDDPRGEEWRGLTKLELVRLAPHLAREFGVPPAVIRAAFEASGFAAAEFEVTTVTRQASSFTASDAMREAFRSSTVDHPDPRVKAAVALFQAITSGLLKPGHEVRLDILASQTGLHKEKARTVRQALVDAGLAEKKRAVIDGTDRPAVVVAEDPPDISIESFVEGLSPATAESGTPTESAPPTGTRSATVESRTSTARPAPPQRRGTRR